MEAEAAAGAVLPCCESVAWAQALAARRPFASFAELSEASDRVWWSLSGQEWQQAFDSHPRIGEQHARTATVESLRSSAEEQSGVEDAARDALRAANAQYEQRFGRVFIVRAAGRTAAEILAILKQRLANDDAMELREAAEQQRQITQLRLKKWFNG